MVLGAFGKLPWVKARLVTVSQRDARAVVALDSSFSLAATSGSLWYLREVSAALISQAWANACPDWLRFP